MGFYYYAWAKDGAGHVLGGTGLYLRTEDMAKLGVLIMNKGIYSGVRYLSEEWINLSLTPSDGFQKYGFNIVAAFDNNPKLFGMTFNEKPVLDINELPQFVQQMNIKMAIIALPKQYTQEVANLLVKSGIKGILNFSQRFLEVPEDVVVQDINIVATLAILARNMKKRQE